MRPNGTEWDQTGIEKGQLQGQNSMFLYLNCTAEPHLLMEDGGYAEEGQDVMKSWCLPGSNKSG